MLRAAMTAGIYLIRHGETEWSRSGRHTGLSEVPLTPEGERQARGQALRLAKVAFSLVLTSTRGRSRRTCELAGLGPSAAVDADVAEWDYGDYEGLTSAEIHARRPDWQLFRDGCPRGESPEQVGARADRVLARLRATGGRAAVFTHGHFARALAARWAGWPVAAGAHLLLEPACLGILGFEHGSAAAPVIALWNQPPDEA
ncbi:MAG TPA: histidine phosphatase family protein [Opitutaceae bacterium]|jgi:probable phosphoglycerate mutase